MTRRTRWIVISGLIGALIGAPLPGMTASATPAIHAATTCHAVSMTVAAEVGVVRTVSVSIPATNWTIRGTLCSPPNARTVQLLQSGATYGSEYWDFGYDSARYSYIRHANEAGFATLNVDRLGIGTSSHPEPGLVTTATEANIAHQLVHKLREGTFGPRYDRVALVGHSYGSVVALAEAGTYRDVDALVLTGLDHEIAPGFVTKFTASLAPADLVEPGRFGGLTPDYLTTRPGTRTRTGFYHTSNADPAVIAHDDATRQTFTATEDATFPTVLPSTLTITAPVNVVVGQYDALFCGPVSQCSSPLSLTALEKSFYPAASSFTFTLIPDAGHSLNLQRNAPTTYASINGWLHRTPMSSPSTSGPFRSSDPTRPPSPTSRIHQRLLDRGQRFPLCLCQAQGAVGQISSILDRQHLISTPWLRES